MHKRILLLYSWLVLLIMVLLCSCSPSDITSNDATSPTITQPVQNNAVDSSAVPPSASEQSSDMEESALEEPKPEPIVEDTAEVLPEPTTSITIETTALPEEEVLTVVGAQGQLDAYQFKEQPLSPTATLNEIVNSFGPYDKLHINYLEGLHLMNLFFYYPQAYLHFVLMEPEQFSFFANYDPTFTWSLINPEITGVDREVPLIAHIRDWANPAVVGPRDTTIGDSINEVKQKFLNCSNNYPLDSGVIYTREDVVPGVTVGAIYEAHESRSSGQSITFDEKPDVDHYLRYFRSGGSPYTELYIETITYEAVEYYFCEGILVAICLTNDFDPREAYSYRK